MKDYINKIIQGDCLEELNKLYGEYKDEMIIVTDPPFNIGYHYNEYKDDMGAEDYYEMLGKVFEYAPFVVIHYPEEIYKIAFQVRMFPEKVISWVYNSNTPKQHRDIAFFGVKPDLTKGGQPYKNPKDKRVKKLIEQGRRARLYDWWEINQVKNVSKDKTNHPCQMPVQVMKNIIEILPKDKIIVDPYMGSGTTAVACKHLKRNFIGIELSPEYVKIAEERLRQEILI